MEGRGNHLQQAPKGHGSDFFKDCPSKALLRINKKFLTCQLLTCQVLTWKVSWHVNCWQKCQGSWHVKCWHFFPWWKVLDIFFWIFFFSLKTSFWHLENFLVLFWYSLVLFGSFWVFLVLFGTCGYFLVVFGTF